MIRFKLEYEIIMESCGESQKLNDESEKPRKMIRLLRRARREEKFFFAFHLEIVELKLNGAKFHNEMKS